MSLGAPVRRQGPPGEGTVRDLARPGRAAWSFPDLDVEPLQVLSRNTNTCVANDDHSRLLLDSTLNVDRPPLCRIFDCVLDDVEKRLAQADVIPHYFARFEDI